MGSNGCQFDSVLGQLSNVLAHQSSGCTPGKDMSDFANTQTSCFGLCNALLVVHCAYHSHYMLAWLCRVLFDV